MELREKFGKVAKPFEEIKGSKILVKAVMKLPDGSVKIVVVFSESTYYDFYYTFTAPSARSHRNKWKYAAKSKVKIDKIVTLQEVIEYSKWGIADKDMIKVSIKYPSGKKAGMKQLKEFTEKIAFPVRDTPAELPTGQSVELVNERMANGRMGRAAAFLKRRF